jgi:hypothetical protein
MNGDTKVVIVGFSILGLIALACLIAIVTITVQFLKSEEADTIPSKAAPQDDGKKSHRVSAAALSSV